MRSYARIPAGTHNARPFGDGVIMDATEQDVILVGGATMSSVNGYRVRLRPVPVGRVRLPPPSVFDLSDGSLVKAVSLTMDVRNAVHGLEVWPFVTSPGGVSAEQLDV